MLPIWIQSQRVDYIVCVWSSEQDMYYISTSSRLWEGGFRLSQSQTGRGFLIVFSLQTVLSFSSHLLRSSGPLQL